MNLAWLEDYHGETPAEYVLRVADHGPSAVEDILPPGIFTQLEIAVRASPDHGTAVLTYTDLEFATASDSEYRAFHELLPRLVARGFACCTLPWSPISDSYAIEVSW